MDVQRRRGRAAVAHPGPGGGPGPGRHCGSGLFRPLGIQRYAWRRDRQGQPLSYAGLALRSRDSAKIAWTTAEGGLWRGWPIVPRAWVDRSTTSQGPVTWQFPPITNSGYGYLWFTGQMSGQPIAYGLGYGGQFALCAPGLRLAIATPRCWPLTYRSR